MVQRIQPAKESTAQEILEAVEDIGVDIESTSGVIVDANGKKYKPIMSDYYSTKLTTYAPSVSTTHVYSIKTKIGTLFTAPSDSTAIFLDKDTFEIKYIIRVGNSTRILPTGLSSTAGHHYVFTEQYIITFSRHSTTSTQLHFFNINTGVLVHSVELGGFTVNQNLKLYLQGDSLIITSAPGQNFICKFTISEYLSMSSMPPASTSPNFRIFSGYTPIDLCTVGSEIFILLKDISANNGAVYKLNSSLQNISFVSIPTVSASNSVAIKNNRLIVTDFRSSIRAFDLNTLTYINLNSPTVNTHLSPNVTNFPEDGFPYIVNKTYDDVSIFTTIDIVGDEVKIIKNAIAKIPFKTSLTVSSNHFNVGEDFYSRYTTQTPYDNAIYKLENSTEIIGYKEVIE